MGIRAQNRAQLVALSALAASEAADSDLLGFYEQPRQAERFKTSKSSHPGSLQPCVWWASLLGTTGTGIFTSFCVPLQSPSSPGWKDKPSVPQKTKKYCSQRAGTEPELRHLDKGTLWQARGGTVASKVPPSPTHPPHLLSHPCASCLQQGGHRGCLQDGLYVSGDTGSSFLHPS